MTASASLRRAWWLSMLRGLALLAIIAIAFGTVPATAQDDGYITVTITEDRSLRDVAEQYLGNSDLWPDILLANGLESLADVEPGSKLTIPVSLITAADRALRVALVEIQDANNAGAQLFAPELITTAIDYHEEALIRRGEGVWDDTIDLATQSGETAVEARELSEANRDMAAEARLSDRNGQVEGQRPGDHAWSDRQLNDILLEEERVRTLSRSTAQITFRDASRLRLNENSQAVIQRMRVDPLSNREEARVSLVEGDFYALLGGDSERQSFEVDLPNVDATIDSGNFWVANDEDGARFANYDDEPVRVDAQGETVTLGQNEGTVVKPGETPEASFDVLHAPELADPPDDRVIYTTDVALDWGDIPSAVGYWLEVAKDPAFSRMVVSRWGLEDTSYNEQPFEPGQYYWRVAALDSSGLPGARSAIWRFDVRIDTEPPYLRIESPREGSITREASVEIVGRSEPDAVVLVDGVPVEVDEFGNFSHPVETREGDNTVTLTATDPAGNVTEKRANFSYQPDRDALVRFDESLPELAYRHFLTPNEVMTLIGETMGEAQVVVSSIEGAVRASTYTESDGVFTLNIPIFADSEAFELKVIAPSGHVSEVPIAVTIDRAPPEIVFSEPLPRATAAQLLEVAGTLEPNSTLVLNGEEVLVTNSAFSFGLFLTPGHNALEFVATDAVGNVTIEQWLVLVDRDPPRLQDHALTSVERDDSALVTVRVFASDDTGLAAVAPFILRSGDQSFSGYLRYNRGMRGYQGAVEIPLEYVAGVFLQQVELQDHAGNVESFEF